MIEIDGSHGEGGGAILRQALGMAVYAGVAVRVRDIRAGRERPGLRAQHLRAVQAAGALCGARVRGAELGSLEITLEPGPVRSGRFELDVGTAGSTTLVLQTVLLPCLLHPCEVELELVGGTDVPWSPPADYLFRVTLPVLGARAEEVSVPRRGYYPRGGGRLSVRLTGGDRPGPLDLTEPARVEGIRGISHASRSLEDRRVAERTADAAAHMLERFGHPVEIGVEYSDADGAGSGITLWTESADGPPLAGSALGVRGKPADEVGRAAALMLMKEMDSGAAVDRYLADQLIPFIAVRGGSLTTSDITAHTRSTIYVAERVLGAGFELEGLTIRARPAGG